LWRARYFVQHRQLDGSQDGQARKLQQVLLREAGLELHKAKGQFDRSCLYGMSCGIN